MLTFLQQTVHHVLFMDPQIPLFSNFFIKNGSHGTIYTFKNYFATVISAISFQFQQNKSYPNRPFVSFWNSNIQFISYEITWFNLLPLLTYKVQNICFKNTIALTQIFLLGGRDSNFYKLNLQNAQYFNIPEK